MDIINRSRDEERVLSAKEDPQAKNSFLTEEQDHILRLTSKILGRTISRSDDEWSVGFIAVSEAIDSFEPSKGSFWSYASVVIKSRLTDAFRKQKRTYNEISVSPDTFSGEVDEENESLNIQLEVTDKIAVESLGVNNSLKMELDALNAELSVFDISLKDLYECSPKSSKTKQSCSMIVNAIFLPPPIVRMIRETKKLPIKDILNRIKISSKIIDRHRKYLIAVSIILDGDYPFITEYVKDLIN